VIRTKNWAIGCEATKTRIPKALRWISPFRSRRATSVRIGGAWIAIWAGLGRLPHEDETPTIAVEFVSEGRRSRQRDYQIKRDEYRSAGVREYWIFDRFARRLTVYRFARGKTTTKLVDEQQTYTTPLLPGFELPLASLLTLMDRWSD